MLVLEAPGGRLSPKRRYARSIATGRVAHTVAGLTIGLANLAMAEASSGRWSDSTGCRHRGPEAGQGDPPAGQRQLLPGYLASLAAEQGQADDCRQLAEEALAVAVPLRLAVVAAFASWALATLDLTAGRPAAALDRLHALHASEHPTAHALIALLSTGTPVEAAAHAGERAGMEPFVARFERWAEGDRRTWTRAVAHRCRALVSDGEDAERHFQAALATDGIGELPFELARTELLYGEWLRRARRRVDARLHLRTALEVFQRLEAKPWTERAVGEPRASGETARRRDPSTRVQLTPRELQIARLAEAGLSNREIAGRLFLSAHTVGYHLHKVYAKLGVTSRADLRHIDLDDRPS